MIYDFHTHKLVDYANISLNLSEMQNTKFNSKSQYTLEMHPWNLPEKYVDLSDEFISLAKSDNIYAIGEFGLDKLKNNNFEVQKLYFQRLLKLADNLNKPVILHIVKAWQEAFEELKKYPKIQCIIHGFNNNIELLKELLKRKYFISLNVNILKNEKIVEYLKNNPNIWQQIGLESDDKDIDLQSFYKKLSSQGIYLLQNENNQKGKYEN